jgi:hypothetical protein
MQEGTNPEPRQLTLGEKRCHIDFNPSSNDKIGTFKRMMASAIDYCNNEINSHFISITAEDSDERERCFQIAMEHLETAQMYAVKGMAKGLK